MGMEILARDREEVIILEENDITFEQLTEIFLRDTCQTVYITKNNKLFGIITLGNFRRNQMQGKELINCKFTSFLLEDEHKVVDFLEMNQKINSIPVIDNSGKIVKEFYRKKPKERINLCDVESVFKSMGYMLAKYDLIYCVVPFLSKEDKERANVFNSSYQNCMQIVDFIPLEVLRENSSVFVCDFSVEYFRIREVLYKKWDVDYMKYNLDGIKNQDIKEQVKYLVRLYKNVAVAGSDLYTKMFLEVHPDAFVLDTEKLSWNPDKNCYQYSEWIPEEIEYIFMDVYLYGRMLFVQNKRYIPVFMFIQKIENIYLSTQKNEDNSVQTIQSQFNIRALATEFDIIYNIIPKLRLGGVSVWLSKILKEQKTVNMSFCRKGQFITGLKKILAMMTIIFHRGSL